MIAGGLTLLMLLPMKAEAQTYLWRYRSHATDCTALTDGKTRDLCFEVDNQTLYKCVPSAGDCDTAGEWKAVSSVATTAYDDIGDPDAATSIEFAGHTNTWTSTGSSGEFFSIGNATNGTILSTDRSGKVTLGDVNSSNTNMAIRPYCTKTVCSSETTFAPNACDYIADGTADDVQIQAAFDDIEDAGAQANAIGGDGGKGSVCLSEGRFTLDSTVYLKVGVSLLGQGSGGTLITIKDSFDATMFEFDDSKNNTIETPVAGLVMHGIDFGGNSANQASGSAIDTKGGSSTYALWDLVIDTCFFYDFLDTAVLVDDPFGFRLIDTHIEDGSSYAIEIDVGAAKTNGATLMGNKIIGNTKGIRVDNVDSTQIIGNELATDSGSTNSAIEAVASLYTTIIGNEFFGGEDGISLDATSHGGIISNNTFANLNDDGVVIASGNIDSLVMGNQLDNITGTEITSTGAVTYVQLGNRGNDDGSNTNTVLGSTISFSANSIDPADATTYYAGALAAQPLTAANIARVYFPQKGTVKRINLVVVNLGTGTTENSTISFRLNNTTDTTISSVIDNSNSIQAVNTTVDIDVVQDDYFEIKWVTPTWVTDPTTVFIYGNVYYEYF